MNGNTENLTLAKKNFIEFSIFFLFTPKKYHPNPCELSVIHKKRPITGLHSIISLL